MQRADQVGGEDEAALEHRDDEQVLGRRGLDLLRQRVVARGDRLGVEQDADARVGGHGKLRPHEPAATSRRLKKRTITSRPSGGGEARRARNGSPLPDPSVDFGGSAVQA